MQISNDDLGRILGRIEGKLDVAVAASQRQELALAEMDKKLTGQIEKLDTKLNDRIDDQEERLRALETANPAAIAKTVDAHAERIAALEKGAARAGVIAGVGSSVGIAVVVEILKRKLLG